MSNHIYYVPVREPDNGYVIVYAESADEAISKLNIFDIPWRIVYPSSEAAGVLTNNLELLLTVI